MPDWKIMRGEALEQLRRLPGGSIQCCVTSPPYWGLRDYDTGEWQGGDADCEHLASIPRPDHSKGEITGRGSQSSAASSAPPMRGDCSKCGAVRVDDQLGLEPTPEKYVEKVVAIFAEVRRVLRDDGTLWLNLGDTYAMRAQGQHQTVGSNDGALGRGARPSPKRRINGDLKNKDLVGIPWMVAFALRAEGWYLRKDIIWSKPNPMPESVTDRPTSSHEYLFLMSKSPRYFYDADAISEKAVSTKGSGNAYQRPAQIRKGGRQSPHPWNDIGGRRNKRSVWEVATRPFPGAHFATYPPKLIEPCVLAGTPVQTCSECGAPWRRLTVKVPTGETQKMADGWKTGPGAHGTVHSNGRQVGETDIPVLETRTVGWEPTCDHAEGGGIATVLDPFAGAATTGLVATQLGREFIGVELNPEYAQMGEDRIRRWEANPAGHLTGDPEPLAGQIGLL